MKKINLRSKKVECTFLGGMFLLVGAVSAGQNSSGASGLILPAISVLFGISFLFYVNRVVVDLNRRKVIHQRGIIFPVIKKAYNRDSVVRVVLEKREIRTNNESATRKTIYPISFSGLTDSIIMKNGDLANSRRVAEQLANEINVPLENKVYGRSSTRLPGELNTPLIEVWRNKGEEFLRPDISYAKNIELISSDVKSEILYDSKPPWLKIRVGLPSIFLFICLASIPWWHQEKILFSVLYMFFVPLPCMFILSSVGRSKLVITPLKLTFREGYSPFTNRVGLASIEECISSGEGIHFIGDKKALWIRDYSDKDLSKYFKSLVLAEFQRLGNKNELLVRHRGGVK